MRESQQNSIEYSGVVSEDAPLASEIYKRLSENARLVADWLLDIYNRTGRHTFEIEAINPRGMATEIAEHARIELINRGILRVTGNTAYISRNFFDSMRHRQYG